MKAAAVGVTAKAPGRVGGAEGACPRRPKWSCMRPGARGRASSQAVLCSSLSASQFFGGGRSALAASVSAPNLKPAKGARTLALPQAMIGGLGARQRKFKAKEVGVVKKLGEGSYGVVYEAVWFKPNGGDERIVIKMSKSNVEGADEMRETELTLNSVVTRQAPGACPTYLGSMVVDAAEKARAGYMSLPTGKYLAWTYEGDKTLAFYLQRRDFPAGLCDELMGCSVDKCGDKAVVQQAIIQILQANKKLHDIGLVHRDIKPRNIILSENDRRLKLVDLGACADLRRGTNYVPDESILDPMYCPPEQYVMPIDTIDIASQAAPVQMAMTPMLWVKHRPDLFDAYSTGLVLLQLAVPAYRSEAGVRAFNQALKRYNYDLSVWRQNVNLAASQTAMLDEDDGAGWDLLECLLRPRSIDEDVVYDGPERIGLRDALRHPFLRASPVPFSFGGDASSSTAAGDNASSSAGAGGEAAAPPPPAPKKGLFAAIKDGLFSRLADLELNISDIASETERTRKKVADLRETGAEAKEIRRAEVELESLERGLESAVGEFQDTARAAQEALDAAAAAAAAEEEEEAAAVGARGGVAGGSGREAVEEDENTVVRNARAEMVNAERKSRQAVASGLVRFGLQFTGLAAKVAGDVARELRRDAGKVLQEMKEEGALEVEMRRLRAEGKSPSVEEAEQSLQNRLQVEREAREQEEETRIGELDERRNARRAEAEERKEAAVRRLEAARERTAEIARRREERIRRQQVVAEVELARQVEALQSATSKLTQGRKLSDDPDVDPEEYDRMKAELLSLSSQVEEMTAAMRAMEEQVEALEEERIRTHSLMDVADEAKAASEEEMQQLNGGHNGLSGGGLNGKKKGAEEEMVLNGDARK